MKKDFIYLVRKRAIGDVLWLEPVIRQLASRYNKVIVHTKHNDLFENYPLKNVIFRTKLNIGEKIILKLESLLKFSYFFINLDMAYEKRPKMHFLHAYQQKAKVRSTNEYPRLYFSDEEFNKTIIDSIKYVVLHLESASGINYRKVYGVNWNVVVEYLQKNGYEVVEIGKMASNIKGAKFISTSLRDMIVLIKKSSFFIGVDSGPSHIAASLQVPALIFFGAVNPDFRHFKSIFKGHILQQACEYAGCYHEATKKEHVNCRLVGNAGIPKCSLHTNEYVISKIDLLIKEYIRHA